MICHSGIGLPMLSWKTGKDHKIKISKWTLVICSCHWWHILNDFYSTQTTDLKNIPWKLQQCLVTPCQISSLLLEEWRDCQKDHGSSALKIIGKEFQKNCYKTIFWKINTKEIFFQLTLITNRLFFKKKLNLRKFTVAVYMIYIYGRDVIGANCECVCKYC